MRTQLLAAIFAGLFMVVVAAPAQAACQKLGYTVNDYGKEGPTNDAKRLLDEYIAKWTAENGIKKYRTGKKTVSCYLFLDFGFFDEWTCKAVATFCWNGPPVKKKRASN